MPTISELIAAMNEDERRLLKEECSLQEHEIERLNKEIELLRSRPAEVLEPSKLSIDADRPLTFEAAKMLLEAAEYYGERCDDYELDGVEDLFCAALEYAKAVSDAGSPRDLKEALIDWRRNCC